MNSPLWFSNLVLWSVQVALIVLVAGLVLPLFKIRQPRVLLGLWRAVLVICLALPLLEPWRQLPSVRITPVAFAPFINTLPTPSDPVSSHWRFLSPETVSSIAAVLIFVGIASRLLLLALGLLKLRQLRRASAPISSWSESATLLHRVTSQVNVNPEFRLTSALDSPVTFGFAAPVVLLPYRFPHMNPQFQTAIACHELLHVRRRDWAHHLLEEAIRSVLWFHPAIHWVIARVRLAREQVVDSETVRLTNARKTYLESLLEFAGARASVAALLAPPFLVERQLPERISFLLKEVRMSRSKLISSIAVLSCSMVFAIALCARTFPLRRASLVTSATAETVASQDGVARHSAADAVVEKNAIWVDSVNGDSMPLQVHGSGSIMHEDASDELVARTTLPASAIGKVQIGQSASIATSTTLVKGHVYRILGSTPGQSESVEVALDGALPEGVGPNSSVNVMIEIGKLDGIVWIHRPLHAAANATVPLFRIVNNGTSAERVNVKLGRDFAVTMEVLDGLKPGDKVILSDMSAWEKFDRVQVK